MEKPSEIASCFICGSDEIEWREPLTIPLFGSLLPLRLGHHRLQCERCGAKARVKFDKASKWMLQYRSEGTGDDKLLFANFHMAKPGKWLPSNVALELAEKASDRREILEGLERGDLSKVKALTTTDRIVAPSETVYAQLSNCIFYKMVRRSRAKRAYYQKSPEDVGTLYVTDQHIHFIGSTQQRSIPLKKLTEVKYTDNDIRVFARGRKTPDVWGEYDPPLTQLVAYVLQGLLISKE